MAQLCDALDANFRGYEDIRRMCLEVPKFGNDDDYVDEQKAWVIYQWASGVLVATKSCKGLPGIQGLGIPRTLGELGIVRSRQRRHDAAGFFRLP